METEVQQPRLYLRKDIWVLHEYDEDGNPLEGKRIPRYPDRTNFGEAANCRGDSGYIAYCDVLDRKVIPRSTLVVWRVRVYLKDGQTIEGWTPPGMPAFGIANVELLFDGRFNMGVEHGQTNT